MDRFRLPPSLPRLPLLLTILVAGSCFASSAFAQSKKPSPSPSPRRSVPPQPLTADKIGGESAAVSDALPDPVAKVNGQAISREDLLKVTEALLVSSGRRPESLTDEEKKKVYPTVLGQIIDDRLITAQSKDENVSEMDVIKTYDNLQHQYRDTAAFEEQIKKSGQTPEKIKANIRGQIAQQHWLEKKISADTLVTPQDIEKFYKETPPSQFDIPEMIQASHILIAVRRDAPPEDALAAENRINTVADRIKKGEKFADVARATSEDPNSKDAGGDLGAFSRERVMPEIGDAAFRLKVGEVSPPVRSAFGYHLIRLTDRKPAHAATLDEVRKQIEVYLTQQKRSAAAAKIVQGLRENAKIEIFLPS